MVTEMRSPNACDDFRAANQIFGDQEVDQKSLTSSVELDIVGLGTKILTRICSRSSPQKSLLYSLCFLAKLTKEIRC